MSGKPFEGLGGGWLSRGLAWLYGVGQRKHSEARQRTAQSVAVPIISVGNLIVGGTGKTPVALALAQHLAERASVAIVSRGYGGKVKGPVRVGPEDDPQRFGDEPVEIAQDALDIAVWVARDRVAGAQAAIDAGAQLIILDDGFSYRALRRDVDLLLFDERGIGNGRLLPAGPLREPLTSIRRADAILLRDQAVPPPDYQGPMFRFSVVADGYEDLFGNQVERPAKAWAAAGIAWPDRFFERLARHGIELHGTVALTDHAAWPASLIRRIEQRAGGLPIVVTRKDAVKLRRLRPPGRWLVARVHAEIETAFWAWLDGRLHWRS